MDIGLGVGPAELFGEEETGASNYIHIRNQQRNGRKSITTIQGLPDKFNYKKILKAFKKNLNCSGAIVENEEHGFIIQLQGDWRLQVAEFFLHEGIADKTQLKVHGV
eukprot:GEMP01025368.1.p2 GENE.GEMP01025368.1~~GEMP01025368.1.p2  ORF type:complete len:107 (-),score=30.11 GEMP01025368.1:1993-2313(-)